jgi:Rps23 Pro-64 3,4-dihydroxylase Tpa1-like proline 4-hydroxylase
MAERYTDISPSAGRLVLFQSDLVAHEVLPAHRPRWALTAWIPQMQAFQDHQGYISLP